MRTKVLFAALLLSATTAFAQQEKLGSGIDKTNMDLTIKPVMISIAMPQATG